MIKKLLEDVDKKFDPKFNELKDTLERIEKKIDDLKDK